MAVFIALLRGINVGRHRRVAMADVRHVLTAAGYADVITHLQSGNVVLGAEERSAEALQRSVEEALHAGLGLEIDVIARTSDEVARLTKSNPFIARGVDPATLHVAFLKSRPAAAAARELAASKFDPDEFELRGTELFLNYPGGQGRSKMSGAFFERALRVPATARKWSVVTRLAELAGDASQQA